MRFLCLSRRLPGADPARIAALVRAEARAVWDLVAEGIARDVSFDRKAGKGIVILECADEAAMRAALARLPLVAEGLIDFDVHEMSPFTQFALLFREDTT
jgi:hypothetical protein